MLLITPLGEVHHPGWLLLAQVFCASKLWLIAPISHFYVRQLSREADEGLGTLNPLYVREAVIFKQ
ncbi:hypothetical protein Dxin01_02431 [Deinococcus xinjiangensis]|uniref:Uncharacterized protein n=1 Tax=Deinococcus xinjiangensis TaxID=457454 RepID=A0ABP9VG53_9DEIO